MGIVSDLGRLMVVSAPLYVVWLVGIIVALIRHRRHPRTARMTMTAIALLFIASIGFSVTVTQFRTIMDAWGLTAPQVGRVFAVMSFVHALIQATAWVIIILAIFGGRGDRSQTASLRSDTVTPGSDAGE